MSMTDMNKLAALIKHDRLALLARWRVQARELPSARPLDIPTLDDHMPGLLEELVMALESSSNQTIPEALCEDSAQAHGLQRLHEAFDIEEVVAEYNILRGCIHDAATHNGLNLQGKPFHIINTVFDHAIGLALQTYATQRALEVQRRREAYLAFVAHDLRTPLFAISLAGRVLEQSLPKRGYGEDSAQALKSMRRSVQQLEDLALKVLAEKTNIQTEIGIKLERRSFDLWPLVEALIDDLRLVCETSSTQLINKIPDDLVVFADASLLRRIFQNLIANAVKYTPNGVITVGAQEHRADNTIEFWVSDDGAGIPEYLLKKIFGKGETDPERDGGTGLGLSIVQTFTEVHGGEVTVESKEGIGSTFRFSLPARAQAPASV